MKPGTRSAVAELFAEGLAQLTAGSDQMAKAASDPLDKDFEGLNAAKQQSDAAEAPEDPATAGNGAPDQGAGEPDPGADPEADPDEDPEDGENPDDDEDPEADPDADPDAEPGTPAQRMAKAVEEGMVVDATPLLIELDAKYDQVIAVQGDLMAKCDLILARLEGSALVMEDVTAMRGQITALGTRVGEIASASQAQAEGVQRMAKAINVDAPMAPKSVQARVTVPLREDADTELSASEVFAKAEQAMDRGQVGASDIATLNSVVNTRGVQGARIALPALFKILEGK